MKRTIALALLGLAVTAGAQAQPRTSPRGWELNALPAINFNSDEGFGYGVTAPAYNYGDGTHRPYAYTIQPLLFFTTHGRAELSAFFDAPHVLPHGLRITGWLGYERQLATPFYGIGNETPFFPAIPDLINKYYYRFGRKGFRFNTDVQRSIGGPLHVLAGLGMRTTDINPEPFDSGATLLSNTFGPADITGQLAYLRAGLVFDNRNQETGPTHGQWIEGLVQRAGKVAGGTDAFTRITGTARFYIPIHQRLVWAQRFFAQNLSGTVPFYELYTYQGSFHEEEGLGGASTVRGLFKNRYIGKGVSFFNEELRWTAYDFRFRHRESALIFNGFADAGRVWTNGISLDGLFEDYHAAYGGGARVRYGENFIVGFDLGRGKETTQLYIGLGYLY